MKTIRLAAVLLLATAVPSTQADIIKPLKIIYSFSGPDGAQPEAGVALGTDGNFYGTTVQGGANYLGTIFKVSPAGVLSTLHSFARGEGRNSIGGLTQGTNGDFYGTTYAGGSNNLGTVFQISTSGVFATLYQFGGLDGSHPGAGLCQGTDGNFYGTTIDGGTANSGTVFQVDPAGTVTTLYNFEGSTNGALPRAGLVQGSDGDFYGTTSIGGTNRFGTVFKMTSSGSLTTLHQFGNKEGHNPAGELVEASEGVFFGTTIRGRRDNHGSVFRITSDGSFTNVVAFTSVNGVHPKSKLVQGTDGFFYGMTTGGGLGFGTVFMVGEGGAITRLYSFNGAGNGAYPYAGLVSGNDGFLYGTTAFGGRNLHGVIFRVSGSPVGTYSGLALQTNAPSHESSGLINVTLNGDRSFVAKLIMGGVRSAFNGRFDFSGNATNTVTRPKLAPLQVALHLGESDGATLITGTASNNAFASDISASLAVYNRTNRFASAGRYTLVLPPLDSSDTSVPQGYGYATLTVRRTGHGKLDGVLGDGTKIRASANVLYGGIWPLYDPLYQRHGSCIGLVTFSTNNTISATVDWFKPNRSLDTFYPAGFATTTTLSGAIYIPPTNGAPAVISTNLLTLGGGNLPSNIVKTVIVDATGASTVIDPGSDDLTLAVQPDTGQFSGSFLNAGTGDTSVFNGLLLQSDNSGAGFFLGSDRSGFVVIEPAP
ncbi:MAG TPA: choice-of-anchor tandem repeat GloVer-containing protein [Verrucomicrobiae bacterium]|nr:choice-of-anchor tandem repeat GloVer-containing protein [Verrucomicrobiae bacterium]